MPEVCTVSANYVIIVYLDRPFFLQTFRVIVLLYQHVFVFCMAFLLEYENDLFCLLAACISAMQSSEF